MPRQAEMIVENSSINNANTSAMPLPPFINIVIPCRNEVGWIAKCLESIIGNDYPKDRMEILVVDGMSDDGTRAVVEAISARHPFIREQKRIKPS
jgi:glycosyltransferase involved in cell wall biosynthesis